MSERDSLGDREGVCGGRAGLRVGERDGRASPDDVCVSEEDRVGRELRAGEGRAGLRVEVRDGRASPGDVRDVGEGR